MKNIARIVHMCIFPECLDVFIAKAGQSNLAFLVIFFEGPAVVYFTKKINAILAKPPLKFNGDLAKPGLTY